VPGDSIRLVFQQRGREVRAVLRLKADPRLEVRPAELTGLGFTEAQRAFRTAWLGVVPGPDPAFTDTEQRRSRKE
jgi:hypothetical protein